MVRKVSPLAGKMIAQSMLVNVPQLVTAYFTGKPNPTVPSQRVSFGTSGHRGSALDGAFNEAHISSDQPSDMSSPKAKRHRRAAVHRY